MAIVKPHAHLMEAYHPFPLLFGQEPGLKVHHIHAKLR